MFTINLDLDGVFAGFHGVARRLLGYEFDSSPAAWAVLDKVPHLFRDLPLLPDGQILWRGLQPYAPYLGVLTALPEPTGEFVTADADKRFWVAGNLSSRLPVRTIVGGSNKAQFAKPGHVLIDDLARNIRLWKEAGGIGILHTDATSTLTRLHQIMGSR